MSTKTTAQKVARLAQAAAGEEFGTKPAYMTCLQLAQKHVKENPGPMPKEERALAVFELLKKGRQESAAKRRPSDKAYLDALENTVKWGRAALPEQEDDPDYELVHDTDLFHQGYTQEKSPPAPRDDENDPPMMLTKKGEEKLQQLREKFANV
jgi:hypothetical protein